MKPRRWSALRAAVVAAMAVAVGSVAAGTPANADPIDDGGVAQIATARVGGIRYCIIPTSELRACGALPSPAGRYTFIARTCWSTQLLCYEIRTAQGECLYYDTGLNKIGYTTCATNLRFRWRIDELDAFGTVRLRPASHTSRCVVYDPARVPGYPYTFIEECSTRPASHTWLRLLRV